MVEKNFGLVRISKKYVFWDTLRRGDKGVGARNGSEKYFSNEGPTSSMIILKKET